MRLSFAGQWVFGPDVLATDAPYAAGDRLSGFALFDGPEGSTAFASPTTFLSLTFEGLGTLTWDASLSSLPTGFATPDNSLVVAKPSGDTWVFWELVDQGSESVPGLPGFVATLDETGWGGATGLASFPFSDPDSVQDWVIRSFELDLMFSVMADPGPALSFRKFSIIYDTRTASALTGAQMTGQVTSATLSTLPEPSTFALTLATFLVAPLLRRLRR